MNKRTFLKSLIAAPLGVQAASAKIREAAGNIRKHAEWTMSQKTIRLRFKILANGDEVMWLECDCGATSEYFSTSLECSHYAYWEWHKSDEYSEFSKHTCLND